MFTVNCSCNTKYYYNNTIQFFQATQLRDIRRGLYISSVILFYVIYLKYNCKSNNLIDLRM